MRKAIQILDDENLEQMLETVAQAGFQYVVIGFHHAPYALFTAGDWERHIKEVGKMVESKGLECIQTHLPTFLELEPSDKLPAMVDTVIKRGVIASAILGARWCVHHPWTLTDYAQIPEHSFDHNRKALEAFLQYAKAYSVVFAVENMVQLVDQPAYYCTDYRQLRELVDSINDESMKVCWDFGHAHTAKTDQVKALPEMGGRIQCTHIHDNFQGVDYHLIPFLGSINWKGVMAQLKTAGYEGALTLELHRQSHPALLSYLEHSYACLCCLEKMMEAPCVL